MEEVAVYNQARYLPPCCPPSHVLRSTDSELRRWDYALSRTTKVYQGHVNEKNFVGLSVHANGNYIACGEKGIRRGVRV